MSISHDLIERKLNECLESGIRYVTSHYTFDKEGGNSYLEIVPAKPYDAHAWFYSEKFYYSKTGYFELKSPSEAIVVGNSGFKYMISNYEYSHSVKAIPGTKPIQATFDPGNLPK